MTPYINLIIDFSERKTAGTALGNLQKPDTKADDKIFTTRPVQWEAIAKAKKEMLARIQAEQRAIRSPKWSLNS